MMRRILLFEKVPFDVVDKKQLVNFVIEWGFSRIQKLVLYMNAFGVVTFLKNKKYANIITRSDLVYSDGWGPVFASKLTGNILKQRVNVGDFINDLLKRANQKRMKIFLLGCEENVVKLAYEIIKTRYKDLKIDFQNGFFTRKEEKTVINRITKFKPNIVLVGMGVPAQEYWITKNWVLLPKSVYMGVGGVFHYIAGTKSRAPIWMRNSGFEWLYRFFQEPIRLGRRYTMGNLYFIYIFIKYILFKN